MNDDSNNLFSMFWLHAQTPIVCHIVCEIFFLCLSDWFTSLTSLCWVFKHPCLKFFIIFHGMQKAWDYTVAKTRNYHRANDTVFFPTGSVNLYYCLNYMFIFYSLIILNTYSFLTIFTKWFYAIISHICIRCISNLHCLPNSTTWSFPSMLSNIDFSVWNKTRRLWCSIWCGRL